MGRARPGASVGGGKTIDFSNSMFLMTNNIMGVGMLALPVLYQQAGWLVTTLGVLFFMVLSSFSATMLCEAMALIPGNRDFSSRIEFTTAVRWYFGRRWYLVVQVLFNLSLVLNNIASIVVVAQCVDNFLAYVFGGSVALQLLPSLDLVHAARAGVDPFGADADLLISAGYLFVLVFVMPLGFLNLEDNVHCQRVTMFVSTAVLGVFVAYFFGRPDKHLDSAPVGSNLVQLLSVCIFSFCFVTAVPSWANEKRRDVPVNTVVWASTGISTVVYVALGLLGGWSMPHLRSDNIMNDMAHARAPWVVHIGIFAYTFSSIVPSVPLLSILVRYNLELDLLPRGVAAFLGCVLPYLVGWVFYKGEGFAHLILWTSLALTGTINYVIPLSLYIRALSSLPDPTPAHFLAIGGLEDPLADGGALAAASPSEEDARAVESEVWASFHGGGDGGAAGLFDPSPAGGVDPALAEWRREAEGRDGALAPHAAFLPVRAVPRFQARALRWLTPLRLATALLAAYGALVVAQLTTIFVQLIFAGHNMLYG